MRRKIITLSLVVIGLAIGLALWLRDPSSRNTLSDGTVLELSGLKVGRTNIYTRGTLVSRTIGRWAPPTGMQVAGFRLQPPEKIVIKGSDNCEVLSAQVRLLPGVSKPSLLATPPFYRKYRLLISGDDGLTFVKEFNGFKQSADGLFAYIRAESYPRESGRLRFRLQERDAPRGRDWRDMTSFILRNPKIAQVADWKVDNLPRLRLGEGLEAEFGELTIRPERPHPDDIWEVLAWLPVRVVDHGQYRTNWGIHSGSMWDASGNHDQFTFNKVITNDWMVYRVFRTLDPAKAWRFQVSFAMDSDFPTTDLVSFAIPWPMTGTIQTNLAGFPLRIRYVNQTMLSVELVNEPADFRISFVAAVDESDTDLGDATGSWGQHSFLQSLKLSKPTQVRATVAIHKNYKAEFTLQPRVEKSSKPEIPKAE